MIQPLENIVWVRAEDGRLTPFDADRLAHSIQTACELTGHADQLLAESVASAVHRYACECEPGIAAGEIARIVLDVLTMLACNDIARAYARRRESTEIRLDQMTGFELDFYHQLGTALQEVTGDDETAMVHLRGLRACVMRLRGARRWSHGCRALAEEILDFVRARAVMARPSRAGALCLEVLE